jgi:hypothetical protein
MVRRERCQATSPVLVHLLSDRGVPPISEFRASLVPLRIDGSLSFGHYMRIIGMNSPFGAGNQFASLSCPGDSVITK